MENSTVVLVAKWNKNKLNIKKIIRAAGLEPSCDKHFTANGTASTFNMTSLTFMQW